MSNIVSWPKICVACASTNMRELKDYDFAHNYKEEISREQIGTTIRINYHVQHMPARVWLCKECRKKVLSKFLVGFFILLIPTLILTTLTMLYLFIWHMGMFITYLVITVIIAAIFFWFTIEKSQFGKYHASIELDSAYSYSFLFKNPFVAKIFKQANPSHHVRVDQGFLRSIDVNNYDFSSHSISPPTSRSPEPAPNLYDSLFPEESSNSPTPDSNIKKCRYCEAHNPIDNLYCFSCGRELPH